MRKPRETRESELRTETYKPPSELDIPQEVINSFAADGYHLRWIRREVNGADDSRNIAKRAREGYEFVNKTDIPEEYRSYFDSAKVRQSNQVICVGDLVLGKIKTSQAKARQNYYEGASTNAVRAAKGELDPEADDPKMKKYAPVLDESTSEVGYHREKRE